MLANWKGTYLWPNQKKISAARQKILVRAANGDLWLIRKGEIPEKVHSNDPNLQPQDQQLGGHPQQRRTTTLANHFEFGEPRREGPNRRSGFRRTVLKNVATGPSLFGSGF